METKEKIIDEQHWKFENYRQRITLKQWKEILLNGWDTVIYKGKVTRICGDKIGPGVYEIYKNPDAPLPVICR